MRRGRLKRRSIGAELMRKRAAGEKGPTSAGQERKGEEAKKGRDDLKREGHA